MRQMAQIWLVAASTGIVATHAWASSGNSDAAETTPLADGVQRGVLAEVAPVILPTVTQAAESFAAHQMDALSEFRITGEVTRTRDGVYTVTQRRTMTSPKTPGRTTQLFFGFVYARDDNAESIVRRNLGPAAHTEQALATVALVERMAQDVLRPGHWAPTLFNIGATVDHKFPQLGEIEIAHVDRVSKTLPDKSGHPLRFLFKVDRGRNSQKVRPTYIMIPWGNRPPSFVPVPQRLVTSTSKVPKLHFRHMF